MRPAHLALTLALTAPAAIAGFDPAAIDRAADACTEFYAFANKRWLDSTQIPPERARWGSFDAVDRHAEQVLTRALGEALAAAPPPAGSGRRKVLDYYRSGMDEAAIHRHGTAPLAGDFERIGQVTDARTLAAQLARLHTRAMWAGFTFEVSPDPRRSSVYIVQLAQGGLGLPDRDYYFLDDERSQQIRAAYRRHVERVLELAGSKPERAREDAGRAIELEAELARASMTAVERRDIDRTYNKVTVAALDGRAPGFPWRAYLDALGARGLDSLNVRQPAYLERFAELAAKRPAEDWRAYLRWHVLRHTADKLDARFEAAHFEFYERTLTGRQQPQARAKRVIEAIAGRYGEQPMAEGVGRIFVDAAFPPEAKSRMLEMVGHVKAALRERLKGVEWMTEPTRASSLGKLDAMKVKMGFPDKWKDLSAAEVGDHAFVENWMRAHEWSHRRGVARIGKPVDRDEWRTSPHIVNAFYSPSNNEIVFPAAILQPPFFDLHADDPANYGGIGMVIGHEITHGFDDRGRRFDKDGNLRDWWSVEDARRYRERAARVEAQYGRYRGVDDIPVNGALTLGENISDIGGLRIAYLALARASAARPVGTVEGFTPEQRFFLSFANVWRVLQRPEQERLRLRTDSHSPPRLRVRGVVANMPEFARAFACDPARALLPEAERGDIW